MAKDDEVKAEIVHDDESRAIREEPPVVARMVIEIRSDGSRTIARGALVDVQNGQETAIEARGDSPLQLAFQLAKSLTQLPRTMFQMRGGLRGLLGGAKKR